MSRQEATEFALVLVGLLGAVLALVVGCAPVVAPCFPAAVTRCATRAGSSVRETCGADGRWRVTLDCGEVSRWSKAPFACGPAPGGGATCLPRSP